MFTRKTMTTLLFRGMLGAVIIPVLLTEASLAQRTAGVRPTLKPVAAKINVKKTPELWRQVEVIRTAHGVPHIRAENLKAAGYALAWMQCEDYGATTPMEILEASGRWASVAGYERAESDF